MPFPSPTHNYKSWNHVTSSSTHPDAHISRADKRLRRDKAWLPLSPRLRYTPQQPITDQLGRSQEQPCETATGEDRHTPRNPMTYSRKTHSATPGSATSPCRDCPSTPITRPPKPGDHSFASPWIDPSSLLPSTLPLEKPQNAHGPKIVEEVYVQSPMDQHLIVSARPLTALIWGKRGTAQYETRGLIAPRPLEWIPRQPYKPGARGSTSSLPPSPGK